MKARTIHFATPIILLTIAISAYGDGAFADDSHGSSFSERTKYLLLDSRIIDRTRNAQLGVGEVKKHPANPLFGEEKAWEARFDNVYANVFYDEEEALYKCWYSPFLVDHSAKGMTPEERAMPYKVPSNREMGVCYATSVDGLTWEKPALGVVEFDGSTENNIVWREREGIWGHGAGIFKDLADLDPARRYKALFKGDAMSVGTSADGIHWDKVTPYSEVNASGDTHNNAFWAPTLSKYVGITRTHGELGRQVARIESVDFVNWSSAEVVLEGTNKDLQTYSMPTFYYEGLYLGLLAIHDQESDRVWTELTWSPDTVEWHRVCPGTPLIANSEEETGYDWGCVYAASGPVILDDEIRLYYGSSDGKHYGWRNGFFNLATLRPDGFAGYESIDIEDYAFIATKPIIFQGKDLRITVDMLEEWSSARVNVQDEQGNKILAGKVIKETVTDGIVQWKDDINLKGKRVRLEFIIDGARLYSFSFSD
jgi:hypothetical protein